MSNNENMLCKSDKITNVIRYLEERWNSIYSPEKYLTLDETIVPFRGKCRYVQYCPMKPNKYGM